MKSGAFVFLTFKTELGTNDLSSVFHVGKTNTIGSYLLGIESFAIITNGKLPENILGGIQVYENILTAGMLDAVLNKFLGNPEKYIFMHKSQIQLAEIMLETYLTFSERIGVIHFFLNQSYDFLLVDIIIRQSF